MSSFPTAAQQLQKISPSSSSSSLKKRSSLNEGIFRSRSATTTTTTTTTMASSSVNSNNNNKIALIGQETSTGKLAMGLSAGRGRNCDVSVVFGEKMENAEEMTQGMDDATFELSLIHI